MTEPIKLPPLPEWIDWPSTVADMSVSEIKEAMQAYAHAAIEADRQARGEPIGYIQKSTVDWITDQARDKSAGVHTAIEKSADSKYSVPIYTTPQPQQIPEDFLRSVINLCTHRGSSPFDIEGFDPEDKWIADLWRKAEAMLEAAPEPRTDK